MLNIQALVLVGNIDTKNDRNEFTIKFEVEWKFDANCSEGQNCKPCLPWAGLLSKDLTCAKILTIALKLDSWNMYNVVAILR